MHGRAGSAFDVVAIGASLGGIEALRRLLSALPADFPAGILIVQHRSSRHASFLSALLNRAAALPVVDAVSGALLRPGQAYVAPPGRHLTLSASGRLLLSSTYAPRVSFARPSVDVLFGSVAERFGPRAIGVVLTGMQHDGMAGVRQIKARGGRVLVQEPATARAPSMPRAAIATGCVDFVLPLDTLAVSLTTLVTIPGAASFFRTAPSPADWLLP